MGASVEDQIELVHKRVDLMDLLTGETLDTRSLSERADASRATINRAVRELQSAGFVESAEGGYRLTPRGRVALRLHHDYRDRWADLSDAEEFLAAAGATLPSAVLTGGETTVPDETGAYRLVERLNDWVREADHVRLAVPALFDPATIRLLYEHVIADDRRAELLVPESLADSLFEEFPRRLRAMRDAETFELLVGEVPGYGLLLTDRDGERTTTVIAYGDSPGVAGLLDNRTRAAVAWGDERYEALRAEARPASPPSGDGGTGGAADAGVRPTLAREGFVRVTAAYLADRRAADPLTAWRTGLEFPEVHAGYAIPRTDDGEELADRLVDDLADGTNQLVVGPPGSGKSTTLKRVACAWRGLGEGPVFYRASGSPVAFESVETLAETLRETDGRPLVVVEDAVRDEASAVFDLLDRVADAAILLDAREREWRSFADAPDELAVRTMPRLLGVDCERLVEHVAETTGRPVDVPMDDLRAAVRDDGVGETAPGDAVLLTHRLAALVDPGASEPTTLERDAAALYDRLAEVGETAVAVGVLAATLAAADVAVRPALLYAVAIEDGRRDPHEWEAVEEAIEILSGRVLFPDGSDYRTVHESWAVAFLAHVSEAEPCAATRFERCVARVTALADEPATRATLADEGVVGAAAVDDEWAARLVGSVVALGREWPKLAPLFGDEDGLFGDELALPTDRIRVLSPDRARSLPTELGEIFRQGGYYDRAHRAFTRAVERSDAVTGDGVTDDGSTTDRVVVAGLTGRAETYCDRGAYEEAESAATAARDRAEEPTAVAQAVLVSGRVALDRGAYDRAEERFESALAAFRREGETRQVARCRERLAAVARERSAYDRATELLDLALDEYREVGDSRGEASCHNQLGAVAYARGEYDVARERFQRALDRSRAIGDRATAAHTCNNLALLAKSRGDYESARDRLERSRRIVRDLGDRAREASILSNLGSIATEQGDYDAAEEFLTDALELDREAGTRHREAETLNNLGELARVRGAYDDARRYFEESLAIKREVGSDHDRAATLNNLGLMNKYRANYEEAADLFQRSRELYEAAGDDHGVAKSWNNLGQVTFRRGDYETARSQFRRSLETKREVGDKSGEADSLTNLARVCLATDDLDRAATHVDRATTICREVGDREGLIGGRCVEARVALRRDRPEQARELIGEAREIAEEIGAGDRAAQAAAVRARVALATGDYETARTRAAAARASFADRSARHRVAECDRLLGEIAAATGDLSTAVERWEAALDVFVSSGAHPAAADTLEAWIASIPDDQPGVRDRAAARLRDAPDPVRSRVGVAVAEPNPGSD